MSFFLSTIFPEDMKVTKKTINVATGNKKSSGYDEAEQKFKLFNLVATLKQFVRGIVSSQLDEFKVVNRIPIRFLSEEDEYGKVLVETFLGETDKPFKVLNKSGEIISPYECGYLEYRKSPTNGWIAMRNGVPKMKGSDILPDEPIEIKDHYVKVTEGEWKNMISNGTIDEDMIYIFVDNDRRMY